MMAWRRRAGSPAVIVCLCHAVSDRTLRELASARPPDEVVRLTRAGTACGCCREDVARLLSDASPCRPDAPCAGCPRAQASAA
jgi:bacterioferritin-associated ferredoxin